MRRLVYGTGATLLSAGVLVGVLAGTGWASTKAVRLRADAARVPVFVACPVATPSPGCQITLELRTASQGRVRAGMLIGNTTALVAPGKQRRILVLLTRFGRRLLRHQSPLPLIATTVTSTPPVAPPVSAPTAPPTSAPSGGGLPRCGPPVLHPIGPQPDGAAVGPLDCNT